MDTWILEARKFVALGKREYLEKAREACADPAIREFLYRSDVLSGDPDPAVFYPLAERLQGEGHLAQATIVRILGLRRVAAGAEVTQGLEKEDEDFAVEICDRLVLLSRREGFVECEALFLSTRGTRAAKLGEWAKAHKEFSASLRFYRRLAKEAPAAYLPAAAGTLNNLANVSRQKGELCKARAEYEEAVGIYRELAQAEPRAYRTCFAMTLTNLGTLLSQGREFPAARRACQEGVDIYREVTKERPEELPFLAMALNNLGNVLTEMHRFPEATTSLEEALEICRELARQDPSVYESCVAFTLTNLGNALMGKGDLAEAAEVLGEALRIRRALAERGPQAYVSDVVATLNDLANVLTAQGYFRDSEQACREAVQLIRQQEARGDCRVDQALLGRVLDSLGTVLSHERQFSEARATFDEALSIRRGLARDNQLIHMAELALTLNNLANVLCEEHWFFDARQTYQEALRIRRELAARAPDAYLPDVAATLNNLGNVLQRERHFPEAAQAFEESGAIYAKAAEDRPDVYRPSLGMVLTNFAAVLSQQGESCRAIAAYDEALTIRRAFALDGPPIYRAHLAETLDNLSSILRERGAFSAAREACVEALEVWRCLAHQDPEAYLPDVAGTLNNLGNVLGDQGCLTEARAAYGEAAVIYRGLAEKQRRIHGPDLAMTLDNIGTIMEESKDRIAALRNSKEAIHQAEGSTDDPRLLFLVKGRVSRSYARFAEDLAASGDADGLFRCLSSLREGHARALGDVPGESLEAAASALHDAQENLGREIRILIAQRLTSGTLFAVLQPDRPQLRWEHSAHLPSICQQLLDRIVSVFDEKDSRNGARARRAVRTLGSAVWRGLPAIVREALDPSRDHDVLVSGDVFWASFPWEALHFKEGEKDEERWLGLPRHLARWGPLTAASLERLRRRAFGEGLRSAVVLCPWCAVPQRPLRFSEAEAKEIERRMAGLGYKLVPDGRALMGHAAAPQALQRALEALPAVIHYTGHGHIVGNEEVLVLGAAGREGSPSELPTYFGRRELEDVKNRLYCTGRLLGTGPLVVLNSCLTGRTRHFGGQREDLAWAFLEEGADAVIASALPIFDDMGAAFTELLYFDRGDNEDSRGMGWRFAAARAFVERIWRDTESPYWPAWSLFAYHGNPYAHLPHIADGGKTAKAAGKKGRPGNLFARLANAMGLRDAAEAERAFDDVRNRLS